MPLLEVPADQAASTMYDKLHGKAEGLPKKLQGVFWMSDNMLPDLLMVFDGSSFDPDRRVLTLQYGAPYNWSWSGFAPCPTLFLGWLMALTSLGSYLTRTQIRCYFNEDYTDARLYLFVFNCIWLPTGMIWTMTDISEDKDGSIWDRGIYFWCLPFLKWGVGSYTLRKVIDSDGHRLHAFKDMIDTLWSPEHSGTPVKGVTAKALKQLVWGDRLVERGDTLQQTREASVTAALPIDEEIGTIAPLLA